MRGPARPIRPLGQIGLEVSAPGAPALGFRAQRRGRFGGRRRFRGAGLRPAGRGAGLRPAKWAPASGRQNGRRSPAGQNGRRPPAGQMGAGLRPAKTAGAPNGGPAPGPRC